MKSWKLMQGDDCLLSMDGAFERTLPAAADGQQWIEVPFPAVDQVATADGNGGYTISVRTQPLDEARASRWTEALAYRNARQEAGCATPLGRVQTDADSQRKITVAVTAAIAAQASGAQFPPIDWTMEDNSIVSHDAPALIAMGMAVAAYLNACQEAGNAIRAAIDAATDAAAVAAIDITAGYPA